MQTEFDRMLKVVLQIFPNGFRKNAAANTIPRVRFEAIATGTALALRQNGDLKVTQDQVTKRMKDKGFDKVVVSDGANVRSKLEGRIGLVRSILLEE